MADGRPERCRAGSIRGFARKLGYTPAMLVAVLLACAADGGLIPQPFPGDATEAADSGTPTDSGPFDSGLSDTGADDTNEPCTPVDAPTATSAEVFSRGGVLIAESPTSFSAGTFGPTLQAAGFSWVAVQVQNGTTSHDSSNWADWMAEWRCYVPYVGAWSVTLTEPETEATLSADILADHGFDFLIVDAEYEYKYSQDAGYCGECFERSGRWLAAYQAQAAARGVSDRPAALTSYGRVDMADLDWRGWSNAGFHLLPQTYWNENAIYQPYLCVDAALRWVRPEMESNPFFSSDMVHPMLGIWGSGTAGYVTGQSYLDDLAAAQATYGQVGFSVFRGDMTPGEEWAVLGQGIAQGLAH